MNKKELKHCMLFLETLVHRNLIKSYSIKFTGPRSASLELQPLEVLDYIQLDLVIDEDLTSEE